MMRSHSHLAVVQWELERRQQSMSCLLTPWRLSETATCGFPKNYARVQGLPRMHKLQFQQKMIAQAIKGSTNLILLSVFHPLLIRDTRLKNFTYIYSLFSFQNCLKTPWILQKHQEAIQSRSHPRVTPGSLRTMHHFFTLKQSGKPT